MFLLSAANTQMAFCLCPTGPSLPEGDTLCLVHHHAVFQGCYLNLTLHGTFFSRFFLSNIWHFLRLRSSRRHFSWLKAYCGSERDDSPNTSSAGPPVVSPLMAEWFTAIPHGTHCLICWGTPLAPCLVPKPGSCLSWDQTTALGSSLSELPTALSTCTVFIFIIYIFLKLKYS